MKDGYGEMSCISALCISTSDSRKMKNNATTSSTSVLKTFWKFFYWFERGYDDVHKITRYLPSILSVTKFLNLESVKANFEKSLDWLTDTYVDGTSSTTWLDKYNYEAVQMAFLPTTNVRTWGFGIRNTVDTLSAIK